MKMKWLISDSTEDNCFIMEWACISLENGTIYTIPHFICTRLTNFNLFYREYIHRVGRTARAGGKGNALLFIREEEIGFISYLKAHKVSVDCMDITWSKVANIQPQVHIHYCVVGVSVA